MRTMARYRVARRRAATALLTALLLVLVGSAWAANVPAAATIEVDAREAPRGVIKSHLRLPVRPGPLTLVYPKWIPGRHSPAGPITSLAGPRLSVAGQPLAWRRDDVDMYAFHVTVPEGASVLDAELELLRTPRIEGEVQGLEAPRTSTEALAVIEWDNLLLYPAGVPTDQLSYGTSVRVPAGWQVATALRPAASTAADAFGFEPVSLTTLVDSPLLTGRYLRHLDLGGEPAVTLELAADSAAALAMAPQTLEHYRALVREARALFGATHYRRYTFLWSLTDQVMEDGLEHHESSDNRSPLRTLEDEDLFRAEANLLPHEYFHSWNGKYRRPAGLATPDFQVPMRGELLWVYEGLTEYYGDVLAARSGLLSTDDFRDELARIAAAMDSHRGREWRSLQDAVVAAQLLYAQGHDWAARLRRQDDFYQESALLWLEADVLIRRLSGGKRSLDDFCAAFHGAPAGPPEVRSYDFDAIVAALIEVLPYDWRGFWLERLNRLRPGAPLEGLTASGWRLGYGTTPSAMFRGHAAEDHETSLQYSLGFVIDDDKGVMNDMVPGSPADRAGLAPGSKLVAINGRRWSRELLHEALAGAEQSPRTIELLVEKDGIIKSHSLGYAGGERYPRLERIPNAPDLLEAIARPRSRADR
jgi:predicted metalloprotease with PDZ domain